MKLKELLHLMENIAANGDISPIKICGGIPRDRLLGITPDKVSDLDITTGDKTIHNLAKEFSLELSKHYKIESKKMNDGHTSIFIGDFKVDFSSNFIVPGINIMLAKQGIKKSTDMQREMFSRDFTCNALLMSLDLKKIQDPTKRGIDDIKKRILKTCLPPEITLRSNPNRIIRVFYLAAKLDFNVDPEIIQWITDNKQYIKDLDPGYIKTNIDKGLDKNPERLVHLLDKTNIWDAISITDKLYPYYAKRSKTAQIRRNFDIGEGIFSNLEKYKSVSDFRKKRRNKRKKILKQIRDMKLK
jgi:tRNA nucleotidyltransferase/poly(A) polymerase